MISSNILNLVILIDSCKTDPFSYDFPFIEKLMIPKPIFRYVVQKLFQSHRKNIVIARYYLYSLFIRLFHVMLFNYISDLCFNIGNKLTLTYIEPLFNAEMFYYIEGLAILFSFFQYFSLLF